MKELSSVSNPIVKAAAELKQKKNIGQNSRLF